MQRLSTVERDVAKLGDLGEKVAVIEERTRNSASSMDAIRTDVSKITGHLLDEPRTFASTPRGRPRGS